MEASSVHQDFFKTRHFEMDFDHLSGRLQAMTAITFGLSFESCLVVMVSVPFTCHGRRLHERHLALPAFYKLLEPPSAATICVLVVWNPERLTLYLTISSAKSGFDVPAQSCTYIVSSPLA